MLQWTRMNQGKIVFRPQKLNLSEVCNDSVSIIKPNASSKQISINVLTNKEIYVFADVYMLKTIVRNLVSSAIKYTNTEGQVIITAHQTASSVTVSVSDNGIGIAPDFLVKLFDYAELHSTMDKAEEKGTTLGLILCKEFVEKHGGKIWAEKPKTNNQGIEFKFSIPILSLGPENMNI
jgi:signal transduction histidine kinase